MANDTSWIERLKASPLGRAEYRLKCWVRQLGAPLQRREDEKYLGSLPSKVEALSQKSRIKVLFFAMHPAYWRCDSLYQAMLEHPRFEPIILVCGTIEHGKASMLRDTEVMCQTLDAKGFAYLRAYQDDKWMDIRKTINPDLLIYSKPYTGLLPKAYEYPCFMDKLFIYLPYAMQTTNPAELCNTRYCQLSWLQFYETPLVFQHSPILERNSRITGSSKADAFLEKMAGKIESPWKPQTEGTNPKRIIWAPHHSIGGGSLGYSNFLAIADDFLALAKELKGRVQFAFKPHPLLRRVLYEHKDWGTDRTDEYYRQWTDGENMQLEEGDYVDLFLTSDAMIHDCGSFTAEYLMTQKPVMYLSKDHHDDTLNGFGLAAFAMHYKGSTMKDISHFVEAIVLQGDDPMAVEREAFYKEHLLPPHGKTAAQNMIDEILKFEV